MDSPIPDNATTILGPIWVALVGSGMLFFALSRNGTLKRRIWPIFMLLLWLFLIPVVIWFRFPLPIAAFGVVGWGLMVFWNYRSWLFCHNCGASSRVGFSMDRQNTCPKCAARVPADV